MIKSELIETFIKVVEYGNISKAASHIFTTQSNISKQLQSLEKEVGAKLIVRQKGYTEMYLTSAGESFYEKAKQWQSLMKEFDEITDSENRMQISIGALDRFNFFTLKDFYQEMMDKYPSIQLDIHTYHSKEIYSMMENMRLDIGIASSNYPTFNITSKWVFDETMFVICNAENDLKKIIDPKDLDPNKEIYSRWSDEFDAWHNRYWPGKKYPMHVGTSAMTPNYLDQKGRWSIVPVSVINAFDHSYKNISIHHLSIESPVGHCYLLEQKKIRKSKEKAVNIFKTELMNFLRKDPYLTQHETE